MTVFKAYAATEAGGLLEPFEYDPGTIGPRDVDVAVEHCGICFTDLLMLENKVGLTQYPFVPGHEVVGTVKNIGGQVRHVEVGERVGLGWHAGYCMSCEQCLKGRHNLCGTASATIMGRHGGFADTVRAQDVSVTRIPTGVDAASAAPLFCGGIAVFNPLIQMNISPTARVGVIGIGGLGHLALQFCRAWGCHVTAFTSSDDGNSIAATFGAHEVVHSSDSDAIVKAVGKFDLLLSTVTVNLDWNAYLGMLKPCGRLHLLGVVPEPMEIGVIPMLFGQFSVSSSPVGSPGTIAAMLEFVERHNIKAVTEHFCFDEVNGAIERLKSGKAKYRVVLSHR